MPLPALLAAASASPGLGPFLSDSGRLAKVRRLTDLSDDLASVGERDDSSGRATSTFRNHIDSIKVKARDFRKGTATSGETT
jgi:hypothetical protein